MESYIQEIKEQEANKYNEMKLYCKRQRRLYKKHHQDLSEFAERLNVEGLSLEEKKQILFESYSKYKVEEECQNIIFKNLRLEPQEMKMNRFVEEAFVYLNKFLKTTFGKKFEDVWSYYVKQDEKYNIEFNQIVFENSLENRPDENDELFKGLINVLKSLCNDVNVSYHVGKIRDVYWVVIKCTHTKLNVKMLEKYQLQLKQEEESDDEEEKI